METVIKLNGINKIYRTDEVETQALENVNIVDAAQHHGTA